MPASQHRRQLLKEIFSARTRIEAMSMRVAAGRSGDEEEHSSLIERLSSLVADYRSLLRPVVLSRCPFTDVLWSRTMDAAGLDGLWWDYEAPVRVAEKVPAGFIALTGSLIPHEPVEEFPFLCKPGPEAPFVLSHLMNQSGVKAVISRVNIGEHTGMAITYFSEQPLEGFRLPNEWGSARNVFLSSTGKLITTQDFIPEDEYDFDLRPYLDDGRLLWIAPGDEQFTLKSGAEGCPYLDLPRRRSPLFISKGEVWIKQDVHVPRTGKLADIPFVDLTEDEHVCPPSGKPNASGAKFRGHLGKTLTPGGRQCPSCGNAVTAAAKFCEACGTKL